MYAKIENNCITEISPSEKEGYEYIAVNYESFVHNRSKGGYKTCPFGVILKNGMPIFINSQKKETEKQTIKETDIKQQRLDAIKEQFEKAIDMNVKWKNGYYYKPRYASESYQPLISAEIAVEISSNYKQTLFPKEIWDATKTHSEMMTLDELKELALYLANIYEKQFQQYKKQYAAILKD